MLNGISFLGTLLSRFALRVGSAAVASVCAGYLLTQFNFSGETDKATQPVVYSPAGEDTPTAAEIRAQTRELLRARRENAEAPAEVRRTAKPVEPKTAPPVAVATAPAVSAPATRLAAPPAPLGTLALPRSRPQGEAMDSVATDVTAPRDMAPARTASISGSAPVFAPSQPSALPPPVVIGSSAPPASLAATPRAVGLPTVPVTVDRDDDQPRSFAFQVFSVISNITGKGANAVGDGVNWVGALPGRAVTAGEKVFTPQPTPPAGPAPVPPRQFSNGS